MPAQPQIIVDELPPCSLCAANTNRKPGDPVPLAQFQGLANKRPNKDLEPGEHFTSFADMCWPHFVSHGIGLGPDRGFRIVVRCKDCGELLWPYRYARGLFAWSHSVKVEAPYCRGTSNRGEPAGWDTRLQQASRSSRVR